MTSEIKNESLETLRFQLATALIRSGLKVLPYIRSTNADKTEFVLTTFLRVSWRKTKVDLFLPDLQGAMIRETKFNREAETDDLKFLVKPLINATRISNQLGSTKASEFAVEMTHSLIDSLRQPKDTKELSKLRVIRRILTFFSDRV